MKKKKNLMASLHAKLMYEMIVTQKKTNHDLFLNYSGHVDLIEISISYNGWSSSNTSKNIFKVFRPKIKDMKDAINLIKAIK